MAIRQVNSLGFVHRGFKLKNLVINPGEGRLVLIDFELAANLEEARDKRLRGTPGFFNPCSSRPAGSKVLDLQAFAASALCRAA